VNSAEFDGLVGDEGRAAVVRKLEATNQATFKINFRLRDWLVSRQRYWGTPIPMVYCEHCGAVPVPEKDLPVELPYDVAFTPDGESPLKKCDAFMHTTCPVCGGPAERDPDTLDTFVCSSWYYLRYLDNHNSEKAFDTAWVKEMMPVDIYVGGAEHAAMHLLYARFISKALRDMGYLYFDEPFKRLVHQGTILGPDGNKMSKSLGNTVSPDTYVHKYGSDIFRMYLGFGFAYTEGGPWNDGGLKAIARFVTRVERLVENLVEHCGTQSFSIQECYKKSTKGHNGAQTGSLTEAADKELNYVRNYSIKMAGIDTERLQFNTAISRAMELLNALYKYDADVKQKNLPLFTETLIDLLKLIAPFTPHFAEEMWEMLGLPYSMFNQSWPTHEEAALVKDVVEMAVQINGTVRFKIEVSQDADNAQIEAIARSDERLLNLIAVAGKNGEAGNIVKVIIIRGRLVNVVVK